LAAVGDLATDTHVEGGDGRFTAEVSRDWEIWGPNGGYIAAISLRAAGAHSRFDRPASLVGHFLGVADFAAIDAHVTTLRSAKRAESIRVSLTQREQPIFEALIWAVGDVSGLEHDVTQMPQKPDPETLPTIAERIGDQPDENPYHRFWSNFDERVADEDWIDDWQNRPPRDPEFGHWYRFVPTSTFEDPWVDACRSVILIDTLGWPATTQLHPRNGYMAPSIDLACAFHRTRPEEPWLFAHATAESAANGLIGCESRVWSRDGALLAVGSSQLLCRPMPGP
jgi:acyl-CoA thioesterase-2